MEDELDILVLEFRHAAFVASDLVGTSYLHEDHHVGLDSALFVLIALLIEKLKFCREHLLFKITLGVLKFDFTFKIFIDRSQ